MVRTAATAATSAAAASATPARRTAPGRRARRVGRAPRCTAPPGHAARRGRSTPVHPHLRGRGDGVPPEVGPDRPQRHGQVVLHRQENRRRYVRRARRSSGVSAVDDSSLPPRPTYRARVPRRRPGASPEWQRRGRPDPARSWAGSTSGPGPRVRHESGGDHAVALEPGQHRVDRAGGHVQACVREPRHQLVAVRLARLQVARTSIGSTPLSSWGRGAPTPRKDVMPAIWPCQVVARGELRRLMRRQADAGRSGCRGRATAACRRASRRPGTPTTASSSPPLRRATARWRW